MAADHYADSQDVPAREGDAERAPAPPGHIDWEVEEAVDDCEPRGIVRLRAIVPFAALPIDTPHHAGDQEDLQWQLLEEALTAALAAFLEVWLPQSVKDRRGAAARRAEMADPLLDGPFFWHKAT